MSRPSRSQSRGLASALGVAFLALLAVICLCPAVAAVEETPKSEYGTVIGIGVCFMHEGNTRHI